MPTTSPTTPPTDRHAADRHAADRHPAGRPTADHRLARVVALPARALHPAGAARHARHDDRALGAEGCVLDLRRDRTVSPEEGSLLTEYGLLALVGAAVAGVLIRWANGGAITGFFDGLLTSARGMVGS